MNIATIKYPASKINKNYSLNKFLTDIKAYSLHYLDLYFKSNRLDYRDMLKRLIPIQRVIREDLHINKYIYDILKEVIYSMNISLDGTKLYIPVNSAYSGVKIEVLYKLICYGNLSTNGIKNNNNVLTKSIENACNHFIYTGYITKWGWD